MSDVEVEVWKILRSSHWIFIVQQHSVVNLITTLITPTFTDHWLTGFTDAEGCFTCSLLGNSNRYRFRFILSQLGLINKSVLVHLTTLIGGVVRPHFLPQQQRLPDCEGQWGWIWKKVFLTSGWLVSNYCCTKCKRNAEICTINGRVCKFGRPNSSFKH